MQNISSISTINNIRKGVAGVAESNLKPLLVLYKEGIDLDKKILKLAKKNYMFNLEAETLRKIDEAELNIHFIKERLKNKRGLQ